MTDPETVEIVCVDPDERRHSVRARIGFSVMEALRSADLLTGECGGALACATCHVWIMGSRAAEFPEPFDAEEDMLDVAFDVRSTSRLSCQLQVSAKTEGLVVALPRRS